MYRDIEKIIHQDSQNCINSEGGDDLSNQKWTYCDIEYDKFCCSYCAKSLCLDIKNKMIVLEKLYNLVKILKINDENEEKCCGVSTHFIKKIDGFLYHKHW